MEKVTKSNVYGVFIHLANELNKPIYVNADLMAEFTKENEHFPKPKKSMKYNEIGVWKLDYYPMYGGYKIVEVDNEYGGESEPLGGRRMMAIEFWNTIHFSRGLLRLKGV